MSPDNAKTPMMQAVLERSHSTDVMHGRIKKPLHFLFLIGFILLTAARGATAANTVTLAWDQNTETDGVTGYKVYYGTASGIYGAPVDVGNVTTHTITGLGLGTYYFAVTAYNASGLESGYSNEVLKTFNDVCTYTIFPASQLFGAAPASGSVSVTAAPSGCGWTASSTVAWIDVRSGATGTGNGTVNYSISANSGSGTRTGILTIAGLTFSATQTGSGTAPMIYDVSATGLTDTTAAISWTTDRAADTRVEYGTSTSYGGSTFDGGLVVSHSVRLNGLRANAVYHYQVKSADASGNTAAAGDFTFQTPLPASPAGKLSFFFPGNALASGGANGPGDAQYVAVALSNLDESPATLTFTALDAAGLVIYGPNLTDPATRTLSSRGQVPLIDSQIFGDGISAVRPVQWIRAESSASRIVGMFMAFDSTLSLLDGAAISSTPQRSFVLPEIETQGFTRILLANPNSDAASITIDLINQDGVVRSSAARTIPPNGAFSADLYPELFAPDPSDYIKVNSDRGLFAYESFGKISKDIAILAGLDSGSGARTLYAPQFVVGGRYHSSLSMVNLDAADGTVTLKFLRDDASQVGDTITVPMRAGGKISISDLSLFHVSEATPSQQILQGYIEVTSSGIMLAGSVVFGDAQGTFLSALPLVSTLQTAAIFGNVASNDTYFTGLAILNPNDADASATINLYDSGGGLEASVIVTIPARQKQSRLLTEYFPGLVGQDWNSGYFRVTVDRGAACFAVFGTTSLSVLSAIPAQPLP